jgi:type I restriction-modification system DNA methylase subunit
MIPQTFNEAFERVERLVSVFKQNEQQYLSPTYSEQQARIDFIDKFWIALGWDVNHEVQTNPYEQEVKVERAVLTSSGRKRADYAFLAPNFRDVLFYAEAKKPKAEIDNSLYYFQTVRYGWNSRTPLAVLTDFEQLRVLDSRYKPDIETALQRAVKKFYCGEYIDPEKFREIYHLLSREAARNGSIEKFAETLDKLVGRAHQRTLFAGGYKSIDESFLQDLDEDREELARTFAKENPQLDSYELTEVTQRTLDRLVFMRFLEDKLIEPEPIVENLGIRGSSWQGFVTISQRLDKVYNGIIFKKHPILDAQTFKVDEAAFDNVRASLAHTVSPYDFNAIPIHILGSIYERFLGKIITVTDQGAHVEEKPEVRKAGGVYYTPEYVVNYIVENTVGKLIKGKSPEEIRQMRFADIACGSGSFLLGIYDVLLRYYTKYYNAKKNKAKGKRAGCIEREDGTLRLSLLQRRDILLNNIYGVDVDPQAVEVAQLSLYLKLLEDETVISSRLYQMEFREALLPSLNKNIICGNSLIGRDILDGYLFETDEERKLNPMNFENEFPQIMKSGGFDAILGNPPYIRMESFKNQKGYLRSNYTSHDERSDLYIYFIEQAHKLLNKRGRFGMIVSNKFLRANYGKPLRDFLRRNERIERIVDLAGLPVFAGATVRTIILLTSRGEDEKYEFLYSPPISVKGFRALAGGLLSVEEAIKDVTYTISPSALSQPVWAFAKPEEEALLQKLQSGSEQLKDYCSGKICMGIKSGLTEAFTIDEQTREDILLRSPKANEIIKPFLNGRDVRRYQIESKNKYLIYTFHGVNIKDYPAVEEHLKPFKERLEKRATQQNWYELQQPQLRFAQYMDGPKIIFPDIATAPRFAFDAKGFYGANTTYFIPLEDLYLLGLLNSRLGYFYFSQTCAGLEGKEETYLRFFGQYLEGFPVRVINQSNSNDKARSDRIVQLVEQIIITKQQLAIAHSERDKSFYERKCSDMDTQIDKLVYELYELKDEEISLIGSN